MVFRECVQLFFLFLSGWHGCGYHYPALSEAVIPLVLSEEFAVWHETVWVLMQRRMRGTQIYWTAIGSGGCKWQPQNPPPLAGPSFSSAAILVFCSNSGIVCTLAGTGTRFESHWLKMEATIADSASTL
jgi:hypothetical protein